MRGGARLPLLWSHHFLDTRTKKNKLDSFSASIQKADDRENCWQIGTVKTRRGWNSKQKVNVRAGQGAEWKESAWRRKREKKKNNRAEVQAENGRARKKWKYWNIWTTGHHFRRGAQQRVSSVFSNSDAAYRFSSAHELKDRKTQRRLQCAWHLKVNK